MQAKLSAEELLRRLTGFNTVSSRSNLNLISFVADYLESCGFDIIHTYNEDKSKANVFASKGPKNRAGLVLSGHTDVVPVSEKEWATDPFVLTRKNDRYYGRGCCDMKGFLAAAIHVATTPECRTAETPLHLAFSYDEEVGCLGAPALIETLNPEYQKPGRVIVGEPTSLRPVNSHKSITVTETTVRGLAGHSSQPELGANAIIHTAKMIAALAELSRSWKGGADQIAAQRTINPGLIAGGLAPNIIPDFCSFQWDLRQLGNDSQAKALEEAIRALESPGTESASISATHKQVVSVAGLAPDKNQKLAREIMETTGHNGCHRVNYLTEAGLFQKAGMEALVWGPGDIAQAHQTDEYLEVKQFIKCQELLGKIVARL